LAIRGGPVLISIVNQLTEDMAPKQETEFSIEAPPSEEHITSGVAGFVTSQNIEVTPAQANNGEIPRVVFAPEGWMTRRGVAIEVDRTSISVEKAAEAYREGHPEWFQIYKNEISRQSLTYYSPELVEVLRKELCVGEAPEGWLTVDDLAVLTSRDRSTVENAVQRHLKDHPDWIAIYRKQSTNRHGTHLSPDLVETIKTEFPDNPPEGWISIGGLAKQLGKDWGTVKKRVELLRKESPELFNEFAGKGRLTIDHMSPDLAALVAEGFQEHEQVPPGWITRQQLAKELGKAKQTVGLRAEKYREKHSEWFQKFTGDGPRKGRVNEYYSPTLAAHVSEEWFPTVKAPEGWATNSRVSKDMGLAFNAVKKMADEYREKNPEWFHTFKAKRGKNTEHYSPELIERINNTFQAIEKAPEGWETEESLASRIGVASPTVRKITSLFRDDNPDWFKLYRNSQNRPFEHLHPDLVASVEAKLVTHSDKAPEGWMTNKFAAKYLHASQQTIYREVSQYRDEIPEWFRIFKGRGDQIAEHYHPDLISVIEQSLVKKRNQDDEKSNPKIEEDAFEQFVIEISSNDGEDKKNLQKIIQLFGAENAVDILFRYRPEFQKVSMPFAKRVIGDYLGEFLIIRGDLQLDNLEKGIQYLSDPNLKQGLTEVVKSDCLQFYNRLRKEGLVEDDLLVLTDYINSLREQAKDYTTAELAGVFDEVEEYYKALFEIIQIPDNVVEELETGRLFPDINQRINILELMGKQKTLIADEMGVGKSASAILAKESLGVKQALVVVPSNVIEVWQKYLSDYKNGDGSAKGYFKEGQAPRVLTINNGPDSLEDLDLADYDYVLVSQERLNDDYMSVLGQLNYDMLIVDEAHKLKNITSGKRADNLVKLAEKIEGEDKYLALLSGTPVPNHVGDVAMILKLLYPEKFEGVANKDLTRQILDGDVLDLRSLLVPRMQMKSLAESIEMPTLHEELHAVQMSEEERNAYEVLLEEDELTASQKLQILRQFALNPQLFEMTPGFQSSKLEAVGESLRATFANKNKVVMFVNGYVDGVIRGENTIFNSLGLPEDVEVHVIDGEVPKARRLEIQKLLQEQSNRKMLLAVSGQTADVGVDFSGAEELYFYNEPWTEYDKRQQQGRVYRPGLKQDLVSHTFYVEGSVEEGIHKYIGYKYNAVEKLLRGIPLSELERELLRDDEKQVDPNLEVNPTLAEHYLSSWHRMLKIYSYVKGIGEKDFVQFLNKYGREYAECYTDLGSRSYQANVGRLAGTVIDRLAKSKGQDPEFVRILDVASGPEMLKRHIGEEYQQQVVSVDINPHHFEQVDEKRRVGSFLDLPAADNTVDYANLSLALHYTKLSIKHGIYEPVKVFQELNRVLVNEGVAVINLMHNNDLKNPELFAQAIEKVGFKIVEGLSGEVSSANNFKSRMLVLQKIGSCTQDTTMLVQEMGASLLHGFKLAKTDVKIKDSRKIVTTFLLDGAKRIRARLNDADERVLNEEQTTLSSMKSLRRKYGSIQKIPREIIYQSGLARAFTGKTYVLFKSLETGNGAVITR